MKVIKRVNKRPKNWKVKIFVTNIKFVKVSSFITKVLLN